MDQLSEIFLSNSVITLLFIELIILFVLGIAFVMSVSLLISYDRTSTSKLQYILERRTYFISISIVVSFFIKFILVFYTFSVLNELSKIVPGAMCGAGVLDANVYGQYALGIKLVILLLTSLWIVLHKKDEKSKTHQYFNKKYISFLGIYLLILVEVILLVTYFANLSTQSPVLCCSNIYVSSIGTSPLPLGMNMTIFVILYYLLGFGVVVASLYKMRIVEFMTSAFFLYFSYFGVVYFFGPYIYEQPMHHCPFCLFQGEYNFIGYVIFITLFLATFYALREVLFGYIRREKRVLVFYFLSMGINSYYIVQYFIINGVLL